MKKSFISKCLLVLSTMVTTQSFAIEEKPLDAFIRHVKEAHTFAPVNNLWQSDNSFDKKELLKNVEKAQPLIIDYANVASFLQKKMTAVDLVIPGENGTSYTIELARYDFFTNDFEVHAKGANGSDKLVDYTPGLYYSGIVKGIPGSLASFSFFNNEVYGVFSIPGEGNYVLVPNTMVGEYYNSNPHYILYNDDDIKFKDKAPMCGQDQLPELREAHKTTTTANNNVYNNCTEVRCYEIADYTMYVKKGSTVANSTNFLTSLFNNKSAIYRNEGIPIVLKYLEVNTVTDRYAPLPTSSSGIWLDTFGKITQNNMHGCDVATLFTTKGGTMGGVAWLGTICMPYQASSFAGPYAFCNINNTSSLTVSAFPAYSWDVEVSTHEMGHNLGSPHTHRCCWGPARNYAIDSCYTIEGSCIAPAGRPTTAVGGTIMSYCHLVSSGIKFANGFGTQPGDTVRYELANTFSSTCGAAYHPGVALRSSGRTLSANRECTDMTTGYTYYWYDNLTASHADDTLVLMIMKNGNNIGNLNTTGFAVKESTLAAFNTGVGQATTFPAGTIGTGSTNVSMNRYWSVAATTAPTSAVEVVYPFLNKDSADVDGSVTGAALAMSSFKMYKVNGTIDPNPANAFPTATSTSFQTYGYGTTASTTKWSLTRSGDTCFAHMLMTNLTGGGTGYYPSGKITSVGNVQASDIEVNVYPNPTNDKWFVSIIGSNDPEMKIEIYAADGKMVHVQILQSGAQNTVDATELPIGMYYYRLIGEHNNFTGSLMKK